MQSDAWDGYPCSQRELLNFIAEHDINNAVFLSGDEHLCLTAEAALRGQSSIVIHSIHGSGMYAPFPFANSIPEDLLAKDLLCTSPAHRWNVTTKFAARGQGFALINVYRDASDRYTVAVRFVLESDPFAQLEHTRFTIG